MVVVAAVSPVGAFAAPGVSPPAITGVAPPSGPLGGGTSVVISGVAFSHTTEVDFGGVSAGFSQNLDTMIVAVSPPGSAGTVDITVTTRDGGTSDITNADKFTYQDAPVVKKLDPVSGPGAGGITVTITGSNFIGASDVEFGLIPSDNFRVNDASTIQAVVPASNDGTVDVTVTTPSGSNSGGAQFTYQETPVITALDPSSGPPAGGTSVRISGLNFVGASEVDWGKDTIGPGGFVVSDKGKAITLKSPKGSDGGVNVKVVTSSGTSDPPAVFTYQDAPKVTLVIPRVGSTKGGTSVRVRGSNFVGALKVMFGANAGTKVDVTSGSELTVTAPAGTGTVDVQVTTTSGTSAKSNADHFSYQGLPVVRSVTPSSGTPSGGTKVTIKGTGFLGTVGVAFGNADATKITVVSSTELTAVSPAGTGTVHVIVTTVVGTSTKVSADQFTFTSHSTPSGGVQTGGGGTASGRFPWAALALVLLSLSGLAGLRFWFRRA
jgi:hypothetical protein